MEERLVLDQLRAQLWDRCVRVECAHRLHRSRGTSLSYVPQSS